MQTNFRKEDVADLYLMIDWLNGFLSSLAKPTNPVQEVCGDCYVRDSRIRVELTDIQFVNDTQSYVFQKSANQLVKYGKDKDEVLNVYFYVDSTRYQKQVTPPIFSAGGWSNFGGGLVGPLNEANINIFLFNTYLMSVTYPRYDKRSSYKGILWGETKRLLHEMLHGLGLGHLQKDTQSSYGFDPGGCSGPDYLKDAFPAGCPMSYEDRKTNNIFNTTDHSLYASNYLSPLQVGRINRTAFLGVLSKMMYPVANPSKNPWRIKEDQEWDFPIRLFQDLIIEKNKTLTITCLVQLPPGAKVVIKPGAKLILDGGKITGYNPDSYWSGISLPKAFLGKTQGTLQIINNGKLEQVQN